MKRTLHLITLALALALVPMITTTGCKTAKAPTQQQIYKTTYGITHAVDAAMLGWGEWVRAGKASESSQNKVRSLYRNYQTAAQQAIASARNVNDAAPGQLIEAAATLTATILAITNP